MLVSGGFDPIHIGHVRLIAAAAVHGRVYVALNSDDWLKRKKGFVFMPWEERREILLGLRYVENVMQVDDYDGSVCKAIRSLRPAFFANGGDRDKPDTREAKMCAALRVKQLFGVGGNKVQSSSELVRQHMPRRATFL